MQFEPKYIFSDEDGMGWALGFPSLGQEDAEQELILTIIAVIRSMNKTEIGQFRGHCELYSAKLLNNPHPDFFQDLLAQEVGPILTKFTIASNVVDQIFVSTEMPLTQEENR